MFVRHRLLLLLLGGFLVAGCSGPSQTGSSSSERGGGPDTTETPPAAQEDRRRTMSIAEYETFDVSKYSARPPNKTVDVNHQVPPRLMKGRADEGVKQTVEGFRVQVFSAQDQEASQKFREKVRQWWEKAKADAPKDLFGSDPPIIIEYSQPYYRVRIGAFADRDDATDALEFIRKTYEEAFVAQSTVTVVR